MNDDKIPNEDIDKYLLREVNFHGLRHYVELHVMVSVFKENAEKSTFISIHSP